MANRARERGLTREDAFTAYAMDRLLYRLGRSDQAREFYLKGGVLVASLLDTPFRFTRDIDVLRRRGPADPEDIRARFVRVAGFQVDDGLVFDHVTATRAVRELDGYDGVKVKVSGSLGVRPVDVHVDIGFGDATVPPPSRIRLVPYLEGDAPAHLIAYDTYTVLAEKIETVMTRFPVIRHRLKDILDVVTLAEALELDQSQLREALDATLARRSASLDIIVLDELPTELKGRAWARDWATMLKEKAVVRRLELREAVAAFVSVVRPLVS